MAERLLALAMAIATVKDRGKGDLCTGFHRIAASRFGERASYDGALALIADAPNQTRWALSRTAGLAGTDRSGRKLASALPTSLAGAFE
jgi:hypothetical protein